MNSLTDLVLQFLALLLFLLLVLLAAQTPVAAPWRSAQAGLRDRLRIAAAVVRYDFWLGQRGVDGRRRRDLREELRANLDDAAEKAGTASAVAALGSLRLMSVEAAGTQDRGPHWFAGTVTASLVLVAGFAMELVAFQAWARAAEASGVAQVHTSLPLFPGSAAIWERTSDGLLMGIEPGWTVIVAAAVTFVLFSRPWLAWGGRNRLSRREPILDRAGTTMSIVD